MKKFLPHCNRRYTLTSTGFVYEVDQLVERKNIDGEYYIYIKMRVRSGYKVTMVNGDIIYITNAKLLPTDLKETKYIDIYSPVERPNPLELTGKPLVMHQPS